MDGKKGPPKLIDMESRAQAAYQAPAQSEKKETPVESPPAQAEKKETPARSVSLPNPTPAVAPATEATAEYPKDVPMLSATKVPEPTDFNPKDLEIKQDDPDSDDEELTEAKKRAPVDEDDFEEEAKPSVVDVSGSEEKKGDKVARVETPAGDKTPITTQNPGDVSARSRSFSVTPLISRHLAGQGRL